MLDFEMNLTYGVIRTIINKQYHVKKGSLRKTRGDEPHIQQLETILSKKDDSEKINAEIMLECAKLLSGYCQEWEQEPSGLFKRSKDKPPKSIQCSQEVLLVFSKKCVEHFCHNNYERFRQAILMNDLEHLQWLSKMKAYLDKAFKDSLVMSDNEVSVVIKHYPELKESILTPLNWYILDVLHKISPTYYSDSFTDAELQKIISYAIETGITPILKGVSSCVIVKNNFPSNAFNLALTQALIKNYSPVLKWYRETINGNRELDMNIILEAIKTLPPDKLTALITHLDSYQVGLFARMLSTDQGFAQKCYDEAITRNFNILMAVVGTGELHNISTITDRLTQAVIDGKWSLNEANNADTMKLIKWLKKREAFSLNSTLQKILFKKLLENRNMDLIKWIESEKINGLRLTSYLSQTHCVDLLDEPKKSPNLFDLVKSLPYFFKKYLPVFFVFTAEANNIAVLEMIQKITGAKLFKDLIKNNSDDAFSLSLENDASKSLDWLIKLNPKLMEVRNAGSLIVQCFAKAFDGTKPNTLNWFTQKTDQTFIDALIGFAGNLAFVNAAKGGNLEGLVWLYNRLGDEAFRYNQYEAYREAINSQTLSYTKIAETITWLLNAAPDLAVKIIQSDEAATKKLFLIAANAGNLPLLEKIAESWPEKLSDFIKQNSFEIFTGAISRNSYKPDIALWLLNDPDCFDFAETAGSIQGRELEGYPLLALARLREQKALLQSRDPQAIFNLTNPEAIKHAFLLLRHFTGAPNTPIENIQFLLAIPALRAIAHRSFSEVTDETNETNELLRTAITAGNQPTVEALLEIDTVWRIAEANNFYQDPEIQQDTGVDLRVLAENRESSTQRRTENESKVMTYAFKHYESMLETAGVEAILQDLRLTITDRYHKNPAKITLTNGRVITLPLTYSDFKALKLNPLDEKVALKAYYSDVNHNALRYLSKPNRWMHPHAAYVNVDPNTNERWSTFDTHERLIAMMWLAAQDTEIPSVNGFEPESKVDHFIGDLALINRAHNWDKTRTNKDGKQEEYDDMEADRPSCGMGVKRRLFQAVPGNPITLILTKDMLSQEIGSFALNYFNSQINDSNREEVFDALDKFLIDGDESNIAVLETLNIPEASQANFREKIKERHEDRYTGNPELTKMLANKFKLNKNSTDKSQHYHAIKLSGESHLYEHLEKILSTSDKPTVSQQGLFSSSPPQPEHTPSALDEPTTLRKNPRS